MKLTGKVVFLSIVFYAFHGVALAQSTWKLSSSLLETSNQISFNQGSNSVWYFLQSRSSKHDPKTYEFLPSYSAPCRSSGAETLIDGVTCPGPGFWAGGPSFAERRGSAFDLADLPEVWVPETCAFCKGGYDASDSVRFGVRALTLTRLSPLSRA